MNNQVQFNYQIKKAGVAVGSIEVKGKMVPFEVTNVSNPLFDLLKGMVGLIYEPSHLWDEENICLVDWYCDTCGIKWVLNTNDGKKVHVKILVVQDIFDDSSATVVIDDDCIMLDFIGAIVHQLDKFIKDLGLLNYEQIWQKDEFPITYFLILKKHLIESGNWVAFKSSDSNLFDELNMLQA